MRIHDTSIEGLKIVESDFHTDNRGLFQRCFCERELAPLIGNRKIAQINRSRTESVGAIRGLHFQYPPHCEMKMVRCIAGKVWDVAVDLRAGSRTFLRWHGEVLDAKQSKLFVIPEGFAHGFQVLEPGSELLYLHTEFYAPKHEGGIRYDDPAVEIRWPMAGCDLSKRDMTHPLLDDRFTGLSI